MRSFLSGLFGLIAVLSGLAASAASWTARHLVEREGFRALAEPLSSDPSVRRSLIEQASSQAGDRLVQAAPFLEGLRTQITDTTRSALTAVSGDGAAGRAATDTLMSVHDSAFSPGHSVAVDLKPLSQLVLDSVTRPFGVGSPQAGDMSVQLGSPSIGGVGVFEAISRFAEAWPMLLSVACAGTLLCIASAHRHGRAAVVLGLWTALAGGLAWLLSAGIPELFAAVLGGQGLGADLFRAIGQQGVGTAREESLWVVYAGAVLVVLGIGIGLTAKERRHSYVTS